MKNDALFKMIFACENSKSNLLIFLQKIYNPNIVDIDYNPVILPEKHLSNRKMYVDLIATLNNGQIINIEVNANDEDYVNIRNFIYLTKHYASCVDKNIKYKESYQNIPLHTQINFTWGMGKDNKPVYLFGVSELNDKPAKLKSVIGKIAKVDNKDNLLVDNAYIIKYNMDRIVNEYAKNNKEFIEQYKYILMLGLTYKEMNKISKGDLFMENIKKKVQEAHDDKEKIIWLSDEDEYQITYNSQMQASREHGIKDTILEASINLYKNGASKDLITKSLNISLEELEDILKEVKK